MSAENSFGDSDVSEAQFKTYCSAQSKPGHLSPVVVFSKENKIFSKDITLKKNLWSMPTEIIELDKPIINLDFHFQMGLLYVITDTLYTSIITKNKEDGSITVSKLTKIPNQQLGISDNDTVESATVDWLNNAVYISVKSFSDGIATVENGQITKQKANYWELFVCGLKLTSCQQMNMNLKTKPKYLKADPYHGYLYWMQRVNKIDQIFRFDLQTSASCLSPKKDLVFSDINLGQFLISFSNYSLLVPDLYNNKMIQVSLDTKENHSIHNNYHSKVGWSEVLSIIQYKKDFERFYWSSPSGLNIEFYSNDTGFYYSQIEPDVR